jgi:nucleoside-diphosphate-sugar epimerase
MFIYKCYIMSKSILITGAGGFIGSHLVEQALADGWDVWAGIRRTTSHAWLSDSRIHFIDLPYAHPDALVEVLRQHKLQHGTWDAIIHNMGITKCRRPDDFELVNCTYLQHFITALRSCGMIPARFALMSSLSAFGPIHEADGQPITLSDSPQPNTAYGRSKLHAAQYLMEQADVPHLIFYPTGVYGPRDADYYLMFRTVGAGFDFIPGLRPQRITFIYVRDLVQVIFRAIDLGLTYRRYIVAEGAEYSSTDFRRYIQAVMHRRVVVPVSVPLWLLRAVNCTAGALASAVGKVSTLNADKYRIMAQRNWTCDITPLREELDYTPQWSLERGVKECYDWYRASGWL